MRIKTSELIGKALNWAVSEIEHKGHFVPDWHEYSTDWAQGGPIIDREKIGGYWDPGNNEWTQVIGDGRFAEAGPTKLIAAMRCYVASKMGDEVEVPDEFC